MLEEAVSTPSIWASMNSWLTPTVLFVLLNVIIGTIAITSSLESQKQQQDHAQAQAEAAQGGHPQQPRLARSPSVLQRLRSINLYSYIRSPEPNPSHSIAAHFKQTPDPDTLFDSEHAHQAQNPDIQTHFEFQHLHQDQEQRQIFETNAQTQYIFEQNLDENSLKSDTQSDLPKAREPEIMKTDPDDDFEPAYEPAQEEEEGEEGDGLDEIYQRLPGSHVSGTKSDKMPVSGDVLTKLPAKMRKSASLESAFAHFEEEDIVEARRPATVRERKAKVTDGDDEVDARADDFINKFKQQLKLQRLDSIIR